GDAEHLAIAPNQRPRLRPSIGPAVGDVCTPRVVIVCVKTSATSLANVLAGRVAHLVGDHAASWTYAETVTRSPQTLSIEDRRVVASWAADCAEHVLSIYEDAVPGDIR